MQFKKRNEIKYYSIIMEHEKTMILHCYRVQKSY